MRREGEINIFDNQKAESQGENEENKEEQIERIPTEFLSEVPTEIKPEAGEFIDDVNRTIPKKPNKIKHAIKTAALVALLAVGVGEGVKGVVDYANQEEKVSENEKNLQKSMEESDGMTEIYLENIFSAMPSDIPHMIEAHKIAVDYLKYAAKMGGMDGKGLVETGSLSYINELGAKTFGEDRWVSVDTSEVGAVQE